MVMTMAIDKKRIGLIGVGLLGIGLGIGSLVYDKYDNSRKYNQLSEVQKIQLVRSFQVREELSTLIDPYTPLQEAIEKCVSDSQFRDRYQQLNAEYNTIMNDPEIYRAKNGTIASLSPGGTLFGVGVLLLIFGLYPSKKD